MVTAEQLRGAFGFEDWTPSPEDIRALKDAAHRFDALLDDRGAPPEDQAIDDDDIQDPEVLNPEPFALTPSMMVPVTPPELRSQAQPTTPTLQLSPVPDRPPSLPLLQPQQNIQQQQQQVITYNIDSPTNITTNQLVQQQYHRFGTPPRATRRYRSRTPTSQRIGPDNSEQQRISPSEQQTALLPEQQEQLQQGNTTPVLLWDEQQAPSTTQQQPVSQQPAEGPAPSQELPPPLQPPLIDLVNDAVEMDVEQDLLQEFADQPAGSSAPVSHQQHFAAEDPYLPQLPQKRPFDTMFTLVADEFGNITKPHSHWDGSPSVGYGPAFKKFHYAYLSSSQRPRDLNGMDKDPNESDTTQGSDTDDSDEDQATKVPVYKQGMSRMELKALDREIPWRKILEMPENYIDRFLEAVVKEAESWSSWQSVEPVDDAEARRIYTVDDAIGSGPPPLHLRG